MNAQQMWEQFRKTHHIQSNRYQAWAFGGGAPDQLADLVLQGEKTATASAYDLYEIEKEPLPQEGEYSVILNSHDEALCIIQTTHVTVVPFYLVTDKHAYQEGEGDKSLSYWRTVHKQFFSLELQEVGLSFDDHMLVVCEEFKVVYE